MHILIVRLSSLGDIIHTLPIISDIQKKYPKAKIDWVCEVGFADVLKQHEGIRQVIPIAWRKWRQHPWQHRKEMQAFYRQLTHTPYDLIIDTQGLIKSAIVGFLARWRFEKQHNLIKSISQYFQQQRPQLVGYANKTLQSSYETPVKWLYTKMHLMPERIHALHRARLLCAKQFQCETLLEQAPEYQTPIFMFKPYHSKHHSAPPHLHLGTITDLEASQTQTPIQTHLDSNKLPHQHQHQHQYIVLLHASSSKKKSWPAAHWQMLIHLLHKHYPKHYLLLPHSNEDEHLQASLIQQAAHAQAQDFKKTTSSIALNQYLQILPRMPLLNMYEVIQNAQAVIGLDTGLTHLASALNVPTVCLYIKDIRWRVAPFWQCATMSLHVSDAQNHRQTLMQTLYFKQSFNQSLCNKSYHQPIKNPGKTLMPQTILNALLDVYPSV